jgi:hypothetical protein
MPGEQIRARRKGKVNEEGSTSQRGTWGQKAAVARTPSRSWASDGGEDLSVLREVDRDADIRTVGEVLDAVHVEVKAELQSEKQVENASGRRAMRRRGA